MTVVVPKGMAADVDTAFAEHPDYLSSEAIAVDLSRVVGFSPDGMLSLLSRLCMKLRTGYPVTLTLPDNRDSLDLVVTSGLEEAVHAFTGVLFVSLLDADSFARWTEVVENGTGPDFGPRDLIPREHTALRIAMPRPGNADLELAAEWTRQWLTPLTIRVLDAILSDRGHYIPTHVVHEATMNGLRHPGARALASLASTWVPEDEDPAFSIAVWDDGKSIVDTLPQLDGAAFPADRWDDQMFARRIAVRVERADGSSDAPFVIDTGSGEYDHLDQHRTESRLLAAVMPGVTSAPDERSHIHPDVVSSTGGRPGMGLFVLVTTVTEVLYGTVEVRTDRWVMSCTRGDTTGVLSVSITESPDPAPFLGNLISVKVPRHILSTE